MKKKRDIEPELYELFAEELQHFWSDKEVFSFAQMVHNLRKEYMKPAVKELLNDVQIRLSTDEAYARFAAESVKEAPTASFENGDRVRLLKDFNTGNRILAKAGDLGVIKQNFYGQSNRYVIVNTDGSMKNLVCNSHDLEKVEEHTIEQ